VVEALGSGCQTPIGALATPVGVDDLDLLAVVVSVDGSRAVFATGHGTRRDAAGTGARVGAELLGKGARDILEDARHVHGAVEGIQP
jgi:porphobilinogen deaminase